MSRTTKRSVPWIASSSLRLKAAGWPRLHRRQVDGTRFVVAASATGDWDGQSGKIAAFQDGAWAFYEPKEGWTAWVADEHTLVIYAASTWTRHEFTRQNNQH